MSGRIELDHDVIRYSSLSCGSWDLPLAEVRVIGEWTNSNGPMLDDYFLCFANSAGLCWEASFYATGRDETLLELGNRLGCKLELGLCNSTNLRSRVLWPTSILGHPMFAYEELPAKTLIRKLLGRYQVQRILLLSRDLLPISPVRHPSKF